MANSFCSLDDILTTEPKQFYGHFRLQLNFLNKVF